MRLLFVLLPAVCFAGCSGTRAVHTWSGAYEFVDSAGTTTGGTAVVVTYRLEVPGRPSHGTLRITGFQRDEDIRCDVSATTTRMTVKFRSYASGRTTNEFGVSVYQAGQLLFSLQSSATANDIVTKWEGLKPDGVQAESGRYFRKTGG